MKPSDFLEILEAFPGKMELQRDKAMECFEKEYFIDFDKIRVDLRRKGACITIPNNEEKWFKFISFMIIFHGCCEDVPTTKKFLKQASQKTAKEILSKFDEYFCNGDNIISTFAGIHPEELIRFAKSGEPLL